MSTSTKSRVLAAVIPMLLLELVQRPYTNSRGEVVMEKSGKSGEETPKMRAVRKDEVFGWKDHGDHVVVTTVDGQKFSAAIPAKVRAELDKQEQPAPPPAS